MFAFDYLPMTRNGKALRREAEVGYVDAIPFEAIVAKDSKTRAVFCHEASTKGLGKDGIRWIAL